MTEPELRLISLLGLITKINSAIHREEGRIEIRGFKHKEPKKNPFLYRLDDKELLTRGKYGIYQIREDAGFLREFLGWDKEEKIGYAFIETGKIDASSNYHGIYETLRLRLKDPLTMRDGTMIPDCSIKFLVEQPDEWLFSSYKEYIQAASNEVCQYEDMLEIKPNKYIKFVKDRTSDQRELAKIKKVILD